MNQLNVVGGLDGHLEDLSCKETYDPNINKWTPILELTTNCRQAQVYDQNGKLYLISDT